MKCWLRLGTMRLLDRYFLRELVFPFCMCVCAFLLFWTAFNLFGDLENLQKHHLLLKDVVEYYVVMSPEFLVVVLPVALLLALLLTLTNHARYNEITAARAAGVSLWRLCLPYFIVGFIASGVLFVLNEFFVPDSAEWAESILNKHTKDPVSNAVRKRTYHVDFSNPREGRSWEIGYFNQKTEELSGGVIVAWKLEDGSAHWLSAERAVFTNDSWTFYSLTVFTNVPDPNAMPALMPKIDQKTYPSFHETPEQMKSEIRIGARLNIVNSWQADIPIVEIVSYLNHHETELSRTDKNRLYTKLQGRLASPWSCLVVVLIAVPFGAASGRKNIFVGVATSISICFIYFILLQLGLLLGVGGRLSPWIAAWFPNIAFGLTGLWLTMRVR